MKTYEHVGRCPLVLPGGRRIDPGAGQFSANIPNRLERFLFRAGHIAPVRPRPQREEKVKPEPEEKE